MSKLETFKNNLNLELMGAIRKVSEGERTPPVSIDIRHFSQLDCEEQSVKDAIHEVTSKANAEINIRKLWLSFWWKCQIDVLSTGNNKVTYIDEY